MSFQEEHMGPLGRLIMQIAPAIENAAGWPFKARLLRVKVDFSTFMLLADEISMYRTEPISIQSAGTKSIMYYTPAGQIEFFTEERCKECGQVKP
jgi:hypothetical protein